MFFGISDTVYEKTKKINCPGIISIILTEAHWEERT